MRILYLHQYYYAPEEGGPIRSSYLAKAMAEAGHEVVVVSAHNSSTTSEQKIDGYTLIRLPITYHNTFSTYQRLKAWWTYQSHCKKLIPSLGKFDLVYASSTPLTIGILAIHLNKKFHLPFVFEVRDAWPEVPHRAGYLPLPGLNFYLEQLAKRIYQKSIGVVALAPPVQKRIENHYKVTRTHFCPNLSDVDYYERKTLPSLATLELVYAGSLGRSSGLPELLSWVDFIQSSSLPIRLYIAGEGHYAKEVQAEAKKHDSVHYYGHLRRSELRELFHRCHYGLVWFERKHGYDWNSPNKFFDYLAAGLPVICNTKAWYSDLAVKYGAGLSAAEHLPQQLLNQLVDDIKFYPERSEAAERLARTFFNKNTQCTALVSFVARCFRAYTSTP